MRSGCPPPGAVVQGVGDGGGRVQVRAGKEGGLRIDAAVPELAQLELLAGRRWR